MLVGDILDLTAGTPNDPTTPSPMALPLPPQASPSPSPSSYPDPPSPPPLSLTLLPPQPPMLDLTHDDVTDDDDKTISGPVTPVESPHKPAPPSPPECKTPQHPATPRPVIITPPPPPPRTPPAPQFHRPPRPRDLSEPLRELTAPLPPTPPSKRDLVLARLANPDRTPAQERNYYFFIGRTCCPPFLFSKRQPWIAPLENGRWAWTGNVDEVGYMREVGEGLGTLGVEGSGLMGVLDGVEGPDGVKGRWVMNDQAGLVWVAKGTSRDKTVKAAARKRKAGKYDNDDDDDDGMDGHECTCKRQRPDGAPVNGKNTSNDVPRSAPHEKPFVQPTFGNSRGWTTAQERALWRMQVRPRLCPTTAW